MIPTWNIQMVVNDFIIEILFSEQFKVILFDLDSDRYKVDEIFYIRKFPHFSLWLIFEYEIKFISISVDWKMDVWHEMGCSKLHYHYSLISGSVNNVMCKLILDSTFM